MECIPAHDMPSETNPVTIPKTELPRLNELEQKNVQVLLEVMRTRKLIGYIAEDNDPDLHGVVLSTLILRGDADPLEVLEAEAAGDPIKSYLHHALSVICGHLPDDQVAKTLVWCSKKVRPMLIVCCITEIIESRHHTAAQPPFASLIQAEKLITAENDPQAKRRFRTALRRANRKAEEKLRK